MLENRWKGSKSCRPSSDLLIDYSELDSLPQDSWECARDNRGERKSTLNESRNPAQSKIRNPDRTDKSCGLLWGRWAHPRSLDAARKHSQNTATVKGNEHLDTIVTTYNLANCYMDLRRAEEVMKLNADVIAAQRVVGNEHMDMKNHRQQSPWQALLNTFSRAQQWPLLWIKFFQTTEKQEMSLDTPSTPVSIWELSSLSSTYLKGVSYLPNTSLGLFVPCEGSRQIVVTMGQFSDNFSWRKERARDLFLASAALVWVYGDYQLDGMALYMWGSYLLSRHAGLSICFVFHIMYNG